MKSKGLQALIGRIFCDEKTKAEFLSNPETVISRFSLTEQEKKSVLATHAKLGLVTSDSPALEATLNRASDWIAPR